MSDNNGLSGRNGKRHRLDELFADQPFLSPTMKARLLHERLTAVEADGVEGDEVVFAEEPEAPSAPELVPLADAGRYLAASAASLRAWADEGRLSRQCAARLLRFRDGALPEWRRSIL